MGTVLTMRVETVSKHYPNMGVFADIQMDNYLALLLECGICGFGQAHEDHDLTQ